MNGMSRCNGFKYIIREGDTLYKISRAQNVSIEDLIRANIGIQVYNLIPGQSICIPYRQSNRPDSNGPIGNRPDINRPIYPPMGNRPIRPDYNFSDLIAYVIKDEDIIEDILDRLGIDFDNLSEINKPNGLPLKPGVAIKIPKQ